MIHNEFLGLGDLVVNVTSHLLLITWTVNTEVVELYRVHGVLDSELN